MKRPSAAARQPILIVVEVGTTKTKYYVHRSLLIEHSEFFKKALSGQWKEAQEGVVTVDDVDCSTFDIFVNWMYTQRLPEDDDEWSNGLGRGPRMIGEPILMRVKAMVLGDRILAPVFEREVRHGLIRELVDERGLCYEPIIYAFANLPSEHPILDLMVDVHCCDFVESGDTKTNGELERRHRLPHEFLLRTMFRYARLMKDDSRETQLYACDYHETALKEEKYYCCDSDI
ncbi:hypothetical protein BKA66DRAFT_576754 [Pyrenochaeta sp. MPI-SDFR-AT-0127]|nr:hypothetical protein BKA66DRAFT_576754 [Pyrenochaeta sp. MPI-SDFR-AT-0127]